ASSGTVASGSGTAATDTSSVAFTYTPTAKSASTGTLTLTFASVVRAVTSTLASAAGIYVEPTSMTYDGASLNPTFYSRHFKTSTLGSVKLTLNGDLMLGTPQAIANAVSSVTYTQSTSLPAASIYVTDATGVTKTGGFNTDSFASSLVLAVPGDAIIDTSRSINAASTTKTVAAFGTSVVVVSTTRSKLYGKSIYIPGYTGTGGAGQFTNNGVKVTGMPSGFLFGDWTCEGWFYIQNWYSTLYRRGAAPITRRRTLR
ncbi:MAG: hypothetical protein EBZ77_08135, partial [Chitinophagia bacterium]|nr:hypothetical protein [Chitinophagia bacterium]